jgi:AraC-like DNA-binding protein
MPDATYRELPPIAVLRPWVECLWARRAPAGAAEDVHRVLPDGCIDLIWSDGAGLLAVGPNTTAFLARMAPGEGAVGVRFRPGGAPALLGVAADALLDLRAPAAEVWGPDAERLEDALAGAGRPQERGGLLLDWLARRTARASSPDPLVAAAVAGLRGHEPIAVLAGRLGVGQRHLRRRFTAEVGYGPKRFARVVRLQLALAIAGSGGTRGWSEVAFAAGYADQSHLVNDCRALAGVPPTLLGA